MVNKKERCEVIKFFWKTESQKTILMEIIKDLEIKHMSLYTVTAEGEVFIKNEVGF